MNDVERATVVEANIGERPEVPSCIESLSISAQQLHKLAEDIGQFYIKTLLCYGYTSEPNRASPTSVSPGGDKSRRTRSPNKREVQLKQLQNDPERIKELLENEETLDSMNSVLEFLPYLNELSLFIERCFATIEATLKRLIYYLNKAANRSASNHLTTDEEFQLSPDFKLHPIFIALMDLIYAIVDLDKVMRTHTNICETLAEFKSTCELVIEAQVTCSQSMDYDIRSIPSERLKGLVEFIGNIQITLCNESQSLIQLCFEHLHRWNLTTDKSREGYKNLREHFERFILFSVESAIEVDHTGNSIKLSQASRSLHLIYSSMIPTIHMTGVAQKTFGICSLFILYSRMFGKPDRRVNLSIARLLQRPKLTNLVPLSHSNCYILLDEFLERNLENISIESKILKQLRERSEKVPKLDLSQLFDRFSAKVIGWSVDLKVEALSTRSIDNDVGLLRKRARLFQYGLDLAEEINSEVKNIMMTYLHFNKPMSKTNLISVLRLVYLIKSIEVTLTHHRLSAYYCFIQIQHLTRARWTRLMDMARRRLISLRHSERKLDTTSVLLLTSICSNFDRLTTYDGRMAIILCLPMLISSFNGQESGELNQLLEFLIPDIYEKLRMRTDCSYLYWSYPTFGTYYNHAFEEASCALDELNYFHRALDDIPKLFTGNPEHSSLDLSWLNAKRDKFLSELGEDLMGQFQSDFLDKICQEFEIELRLQSHRDLYLDNHSPYKRHLYNFKQIFASSRTSDTVFSIFDKRISLRYHIEHYLNKICYNLTSIAPHDWFTYDSMLNLARHRYEFKFANSLLPTQSLDHGLDLIDITRNLSLFVSKYGYDLVNQLFIEKCSNRMSTSSASSTFSGTSMLSSFTPSTSNQSLNVLQVKHIEGSLQTHGYGLLDSSVNCTYQVLKRLINLLSKQLTDDKLRAILTKELQKFEQSSKSATSDKQCSMSFEKANKIAKLFKTSTSHQTEAQTVGIDLDSLRQLITQIGNLLAFIRMLKNGALNCASKSVNYLPNIDDLSNLKLSKFLQRGFRGHQNETIKRACGNFDQCLEDLDENFSPKTNYFNIIISLFTNILSDKSDLAQGAQPVERKVSVDRQSASESVEDAGETDEQPTVGNKEPVEQSAPSSCRLTHFKLFFLLVPALMINYIDHIINCKERVTSRSSVARFGALISDDGFPMGVAFLLTVLNQTQDFARIEWFKQVSAKLDSYKNEVRQRIEDSRYEESLKQTSSMTLGRLSRLQVEYVALDFTLGSALLFFRSHTLAR